jgi:hypothetical protein
MRDGHVPWISPAAEGLMDYAPLTRGLRATDRDEIDDLITVPRSRPV